ncbi:hypothetical protein C8J56DRAFT_898820 [Mycena floridula]|nr:hypothetical protein C8J56DRAFT_898820 [Mycena floridula]
MGRAKKTRSSTSTIPAPQMATSSTVPSGIGPSDTAASPSFHILPTITSEISGNSPVTAPIASGGSDPQLPSDRAPSFIAGAQTNMNPSTELGRGEPSPSIGPAAVTSNATSRVTIEEIEDPEASTSSLSNEQRRLHRADKQKHHGADIPFEEDDILAQQAILNSIHEHNNRHSAKPSDSRETAPSAQIPESYSGILEAALAHLMSPRHDSESEEDFALRMDALRRLRDPDRFNGPSNESSNHVLPQAPTQPFRLARKVPNPLAPERPAHHARSRASTIAASHVEPTATPLSGTPEIYAPAFTAEVDWQNRVVLQHERFRLIRTCGRSSVPDQNIGFDRDGLPFDRNGPEQATRGYSEHYTANRDPRRAGRLPRSMVNLLILVPTSLKTPPKTRGLTQDLSILKGVDNTLKKSVVIDASDIGVFSELDMRIIIRREFKTLAILIVLLKHLLSVMKIILEENAAGDWSGESTVGEACELGLNKSMKLNPPIYRGSSKAKDYDEWIMKHLRFLLLSGLGGNEKENARIKMLGICLEGKALTWYNDEVEQMHHAVYNIPRRNWTYKAILWELYQHCVRGSSRNDSSQDFHTARYDATAGIQSLVSCLISAGSRMVRPPTDHEMAERIIDALPMSINRWLVEHHGVVPSIISRRRLVKYIREYENLQDDIHFLEERQWTRQSNLDRSRPSRGSGRDAAGSSSRPGISRPSFTPQTSRTEDSHPVRGLAECDNRDRDRGHDWNRNRAVVPTNIVECFACKEKGHYANDPICRNYGKARPALHAIQEETIALPSEEVNSTSAVLGEQLHTITDERIIDEPSLSDSDGDSCSIASGDDFTSMSDQGERSNMMCELPDFDCSQFDMWENECFLDLLFYEPNDVDIYISTHMHYLDDSLRRLSYELFDQVTRETHYTSDEPGVITNSDYTDSVSNDDLPALTTDWSFIPSDEDPWGFSAPHNGHYPDLSTDIQWLDDFEEEVEDMLIDDQNRRSGRYNKSLFFEKSFESNCWLEGDHRKDNSDDDTMPSLCIASDSESDCDDFEMTVITSRMGITSGVYGNWMSHWKKLVQSTML